MYIQYDTDTWHCVHFTVALVSNAAYSKIM